ncbi:hypothetical protein [Caudoviricetes sp.]|nr:hypothetical protein [Caudoviricetes sp.]
MALPPSMLEKVIKDLPDNFSMKAASVPNTLMKAGVKAEELKFANLGLEDYAKNNPTEKLYKTDLLDSLAKRSDKQDVVVTKEGQGVDYGNININGKPNGNYEEHVYTFGLGANDFKYTSPHFPEEPQYLAHARTDVLDINGKKARTILEIQSDFHSANRAGVEKDTFNMLDNLAKKQENGSDLTTQEYGTLQSLGLEDSTDLGHYLATTKVKPTVAAPYTTNLNRKILERQIQTSIEQGAEYTAIPISGKGVAPLARSEAVQNQYETSIANTAKKVAAEQGLTVTEETASQPISQAVKNTLNTINTNSVNPLVLKPQLSSGNIQPDTVKLFEQLGMTPGTNPKAWLHATEEGQALNEVVNKASGKIGELEVLKSDPVNYLVIHHPEGTKTGFKLYEAATPIVVVGAAYKALTSGYKEDEVANYLETKQGYSKEDAATFTSKVKKAIDAGYTVEQVQEHLAKQDVTISDEKSVSTQVDSSHVLRPFTEKDAMQKVDEFYATKKPRFTEEQIKQGTHFNPIRTGPSGSLKDPKDLEQTRLDIKSAQNARDFVASQEILNPPLHTMMDEIQAWSFGGTKAKFVEQENEFQKQRVIDLAAKQGFEFNFDPENNKWLIRTEDGWADATPTLPMVAQKNVGSITLGIAGAIRGGQIGAEVPVPHPALKGLSIAGGGIIGGAVGTVAGSEIDYLFEAADKSVELNAKVQLNRTINAAQQSVIWDALGLAAFQSPRAVRSIVGQVKAAKATTTKFFDKTDAIDQALADTMFVNKDEANQLVTMLNKYSDVPGMSDTSKRVAASVLTQPGGEGVVKAIARLDPLASRAIAKTIDSRAQDILATANNLSDKNLGKLVSEDLNNYVNDTKKFYGDVKLEAAKAPLAEVWQFNLDKVAVEPMLAKFKENVSLNIEDIGMRAKYLARIRKIQTTTLTRNFNDLLELRQLVNDFKYNSNITKPQDYDRVNSVLSSIDTAVTQGAKEVIPESDKWLNDFAQAKFQYAQMKTVQSNVMFKALTKPGIDYDRTVSALTKYITAEDSTFTDVVAKLPNSTRAKVEGSVLKALTDKYTAGAVGNERAIHFPQLSKALDGVNFTTPEARKFKMALQDMAEVFRNDVPLSTVSGSLVPPDDVSILATSLTGVAKRNFVQKIVNFALRQVEPNTSKMVRLAADVLEKPLNTKSMKDLMAELDGKIDISTEARELVTKAAQEQAQKGEIGMPKLLFYGNGKTLSTKGTGEPVKIAAHRIASIEQAMKIAEANGIGRSDTALIDAALVDAGYKAVQYGADKIRVLQ